jgi:hypothetical protein
VEGQGGVVKHFVSLLEGESMFSDFIKNNFKIIKQFADFDVVAVRSCSSYQDLTVEILMVSLLLLLL